MLVCLLKHQFHKNLVAYVYKEDDYAVKVDEDLKNETCWLISNAQKNEMEPIMITIEPGGTTYPDNPHEGEEIGYVIEGTVTIVIGSNSYQARKGESFYIKPDKPHYLANNGRKTVKAIWISSPPSFSSMKMSWPSMNNGK